ncbi:MAG TPA: hypothetical protein VJM80_04210, partial [bacterium]|nr:hypothetical protein [bacterium]
MITWRHMTGEAAMSFLVAKLDNERQEEFSGSFSPRCLLKLDRTAERSRPFLDTREELDSLRNQVLLRVFRSILVPLLKNANGGEAWRKWRDKRQFCISSRTCAA